MQQRPIDVLSPQQLARVIDVSQAISPNHTVQLHKLQRLVWSCQHGAMSSS